MTQCKLCRRLTGAAFIAILVVEGLILFFSVQNFEKNQMKNIEREGLSVVRTWFQLSDDIYASLKIKSQILGERSVLIRATVYDGNANMLARYEQPNHSVLENNMFTVQWGPNEIGYPVFVEARLDKSAVPQAVTNFIWKIIGLVLIISAFVTIVSMAMVGHFVLSPIRSLRKNVIRASEDPSHPENHKLVKILDDELGDVSDAFNTLLDRLAGAFSEIRAQQASLSEHNASLEKTVSERTLELQQVVRDLRREAMERERVERALDASNDGISSEHLRRLAYTDTLTGLANRDLFNDRCSQALNRLARSETMAALHLINIKRFKVINETYGTQAGDEVLQIVAERLGTLVRESDTLARLSADEFALIQLDINKADQAAILANRMIERLSEPFLLNGEETNLKLAIGIALLPHDGQTLEDALIHVTLAQRKASEENTSSYHFYVEEMDQQARERQKLERDLSKALPNNELELHFQPKLNLKTGKTDSMEALLRWHHPDRGYVSPAQFIPIAEGSSLIVQIGDWVLREACKTAKTLLNKGYGGYKVAVNVSPVQLRESCLLTTVRQILLETALNPKYLELELTETGMMEDAEHTIDVLSNLRKLGVSISIDDFGTGYSSLSYLKRFPVQRIKIDKSFVDEITDEYAEAAIARAVITMGHSMGMEVTAEGVEHSLQKDFLSKMGCNELQGYLFAKPLPPDQLEDFLENGPRAAQAAE